MSVSGLLLSPVFLSIFSSLTFLTFLSNSLILLTFLLNSGCPLPPRYLNGIVIKRTVLMFLIIVAIKSNCWDLMVTLTLIHQVRQLLSYDVILPGETSLLIRVTRVELPGEFSVYKYTPEYVITHLPEESSENRIRLLEGYSTLYIQVPLAIKCPKDQGQKYRSRQLIKCYIIII